MDYKLTNFSRIEFENANLVAKLQTATPCYFDERKVFCYCTTIKMLHLNITIIAF